MTNQEPKMEIALHGQIGALAMQVNFAIPARGVSAIFGPSGCGKTTLLRSIAGLVHLQGQIKIGSAIWQDSARGIFVPTHQRAIGYVFQEASLFPHLSVAENLRFGEKRTKTQAIGHKPAFDDVVSILTLDRLLERRPQGLSGGERQRVAIGRALLSRPSILLMDEPLSALDHPARAEILPFLEHLHEAMTVPVLYVSHDFAELQRLADQLILMSDGRIQAVGELSALQTREALTLLPGSDISVVIDGVVTRIEPEFDLAYFSCAGGEIAVTGEHCTLGERRRLKIKAADVSLARTPVTDSSIINILPALVLEVSGSESAAIGTVVLSLGHQREGAKIVARVTRKSLRHLDVAPGMQLYAQIKGASLILP